ncbi:MAG: class I SAM-dependent methyltransferase [Desulfobacteraceae bacterium]
MSNRFRQMMKKLHPEGIPWPWRLLYNAVSSTAIFREHYEQVARDVARRRRFARILDIGTGPGYLLLALRSVLPEAKIVGVDISSAMVSQARRNLNRRGRDSQIEVGVADTTALPFTDASFQCVVSTGSLHHWRDPIPALSEAYRVLTPGGYAMIYDLVRDMPEGVGRAIRIRFGNFRCSLLWLHHQTRGCRFVDIAALRGRETWHPRKRALPRIHPHGHFG